MGQTPAQLLTHSPSSTGQGETIAWKRSWDKIKTGKLLASYCHGQNRLNLRKINLFTILKELDSKKWRQTIEMTPPTTTSQAQLNSFIPDSSAPTHKGHRGIWNWRYQSFLNSVYMLLPPHTLSHSRMGSPWAAVPFGNHRFTESQNVRDFGRDLERVQPPCQSRNT